MTMTEVQLIMAVFAGVPVAAFAVAIAIDLAAAWRHRKYWKDQASKESK
jgi:hypothetical protein